MRYVVASVPYEDKWPCACENCTSREEWFLYVDEWISYHGDCLKHFLDIEHLA